MSALHVLLEEEPDELGEYPRLPDCSGVEPPRDKRRLSDSYFKLEGEEWIPHVVDDPALPGRVHAGGRLLNWGLREECVTRILFESGGRVSPTNCATRSTVIKDEHISKALITGTKTIGRGVYFSGGVLT